MRVLVTSTRLPAAVELVRKIGRAGHEVYASDTFRSAPGSHSSFVRRRCVTPEPRAQPAAFVEAVVRIVEEEKIERIVPAFEEVFYLAAHRDRFGSDVELFFPSFDVLRQLHDKVAFLELAKELGLRVAPHLVASSFDELRSAIAEYPRYFARPAYSRGGVTLLTNTGKLASEVRLEDCEPTEQNPFVVQPFIEGEDVCAFGIAQHGRLVAFSAYVHPFTMENAGGIVFEAIETPEALEAMRRVVEATDYHGMISLDFLNTDEGLTVIECNPRPTAGLTVMPDAMFDDAMMGRGPETTRVAPAGPRRQLSLGLIRNMFAHPSEIPATLEELLSGDPDVYAVPGDLLPLLYQVVAYSHVVGYRLREHRMDRSDIMQGYFYDITWDGGEAL